MLRYLVVYASETGNTKRVAEEIFRAIRDRSKTLIDIRRWNGSLEAETYFVGYWVNHGSCSLEIIDLLSSLHEKRVALFGTCGLADTEHYYEKLERSARVWLPADNDFLGSYFCRGRMQEDLWRRYENGHELVDPDHLNRLLRAFDEAKSHPDRQDLLKANIFVDDILRAAGK